MWQLGLIEEANRCKRCDIMKTSENGIKLIKKFVPFREKSFFNSKGEEKIGYGHVCVESFPDGITKDEATDLLVKDLHFAEELLKGFELNQSQFDALVSFIWFEGSRRFKLSAMKRELVKNNLNGVADSFSRYIYDQGILSNKLVLQRKLEQELFLS